ncbi:EAL domain-containing protein [Salimicrobium halophilum]|uniref:EAL domain, c-di-GMP-specific phosphodiesterase class I (Or its enzymatically inactive variant) n=1 Tax=Salimicrobium halophilum TaxID=86666 RepID=A0A1G8T448_9BACI|nr:EAL domain-containing protein [Salimicrobium halophilum]SDJ36389.1 EAL domain, c-di-GMP-specific phosphodiesterase class I (or its enzymatically inactive variant) [Salimicrobium halophilum]
MGCNNCIVGNLIVDVKVTGEGNMTAMPSLMSFIQAEDIQQNSEEYILRMEEADAVDFADFSGDHLDRTQIFYKVPDKDWDVIEGIYDLSEHKWIDDVIKKRLVTCHYQPIVTDNGDVYAYEMLARFYNEEGETIFPGEIFGAAKERGRLYALDRLCRMTAVRHSVNLKDKLAFINFIPTSIYNPEFCLRSTTALATQLSVDPRQLVFEVVETEQVKDVEHLKSILNYYRSKGFQYALDDVGEGFSTMTMLQDIKPNYMKLDMKYVQGVADDESKQKVAKQFLTQARKDRAVPLAEGIEEEEDFEWLKKEGYQLFQGYMFGKPSPEVIA